MNRLFLVCSLASLAACGVDMTQSSEFDDRAQAVDEIVMGTEDRGDPAVVAILGKVQGKEGSALCTGTLISPTVVLTAAHCVSPAVLGGPATFTVVNDWNLNDGVPPENRLAVKEAHYDPLFNHQNLPGGHDIAVVILQQPAPMAPKMWNPDPLPQSLVNSRIRIVGYGLNDGFDQEGKSAGTKRQATTKLKSFDSLLVKTGSFLSARICNGDSGGPVFATINGVERVIGVNSYGMIFCVSSGNSTRVDSYSSFVRQWVR